MDDLKLNVFKWEDGDTITDLDYYIASNINTHKSDYILKIIYNYDKYTEIVDDIDETETSKEINKYISTYFKMYFIDDLWKDFYENFVEKMKDIKMHCPNYLLWIIRVFDDEELDLFITNVCKKCYGYYLIFNDPFNKVFTNKMSSMLFLISEIITMDDGYIKQYIINSNYKIDKPLIEADLNLLNISLILPSFMNDNWETDVNLVHNIFCYMLRKRYYKDLVIKYISNITEQYNYRTKSFYIATNRGVDEINRYLVTLTSVLLLLWNGARKIHPNKIKDIKMMYIYSNDCEMPSLSSEDVFWSDSLIDIPEDIENDFSFLTKCFFFTMKMAYVTLFPLIKIHLRIKKKLDDTQIILKDIIKKWGSYDDIPIIDKAIYDRLRKSETELTNKKMGIEKIFIENSSFQLALPKFYEDFFTIGINLLEKDELIEFHSIPEFFLDSALEFMIFNTLDISSLTNSPSAMKFIFQILNNDKLIKNPYLKFKMIEYLSLDNRIIDSMLSVTVFHKSNLIFSLIMNFVEISDFSLNDDVRNKLLMIINYMLRTNEECKLEYKNLSISKTEAVKKFLYSELGVLSNIFDTIVSKFKRIKDIDDRNNETPEDSQLRSYYKDDIGKYTSWLITIMKNIMVSNSIEEYVEIFFNDELLSKIINLINYFVQKIVFSEKDIIKDEPQEYFFDKKLMLKFSFSILKMYGLQKKFVKVASMETSFYKKQYWLDALKQCNMKAVYDEIETADLVDIITDIDYEIERVNKKMSMIEIPDKFLDPIMQTLINEPVYLPGMDIILEKTIISKHLLTNSNNPFTREPLDMAKLIEHNKKEEISKKLEVYKTELNNWKKSVLDDE